MKSHALEAIVVLNDGKTWTSIKGTSIRVVRKNEDWESGQSADALHTVAQVAIPAIIPQDVTIEEWMETLKLLKVEETSDA